jgi:hypothetical protein
MLYRVRLLIQAGRDAQAAASQAADARTQALAAEKEAGVQRAAADWAAAREQQLQDTVKRLAAEVQKWKEASQATPVTAADADGGDAREAKDALKVWLHAAITPSTVTYMLSQNKTLLSTFWASPSFQTGKLSCF